MQVKVIDGIDLETGEIIDDSVIPSSPPMIEEVEIDHDLEERVGFIDKLWPDLLHHFDSDRSGYLIVPVETNVVSIQTPIAIRFQFNGNNLQLTSPVITQIKTFNLKNWLDIDKLIDTESMEDILKQHKQAFKLNWKFRKETPYALAKMTANSLSHKLFKVVMLSKVDAHFYSRLDKKVLLGESLVEKLLHKGNDYVITEKDSERHLYCYQSLLETKTVNEIVALL